MLPRPTSVAPGRARVKHELRLPSSPTLCHRYHRRLVPGPIVQGGWIEIGAIRPHEGMGFVVESDGIERRQHAQRRGEGTLENPLRKKGADHPARGTETQPT